MERSLIQYSAGADRVDLMRTTAGLARAVDRRVFRLWVIVLVLCGILGYEAALAQETVNLDHFVACSRCRLAPQAVLRLGTTAPDLIESEYAWAAYDEYRRRYIVVGGPATMGFFDERGNLLSVVGRRGRGPGEFEYIRDVRAAAGYLAVIDGGQGRWAILDPQGLFRHHHPLPYASGRIMRLSGDTALVAAMAWGPRSVGYPLHQIDVSTGADLHHFGSARGEYNAADLWADRVIAAAAPASGSTWIARPNELRFEEWSSPGRLARVVTGHPDWFPKVTRLPPFGSTPATRMRAFAIDSQDRLWVLTWTASTTWREAVRTATRTPDGEYLIDPARYFHTRLDVFDLRGRVHVGSHRWANDKVQLLEKGGEVWIQMVEFDEQLRMAVVLYRMDIQSPPRGES
jgi:hypothetical protein